MSGVYVKNNCAIVLLFLVNPSEEVNCAILCFNVTEKMLNSDDINDKEIAELLLRMMKSGTRCIGFLNSSGDFHSFRVQVTMKMSVQYELLIHAI